MTTIVTRAGKGSALTWVEGDANFTNLNTDKIENVLEDTTPQLGGDLDVNDFNIKSTTSNGVSISNESDGGISLTGSTIFGMTSSSIQFVTTDGNIDLMLFNPTGNTGRITIGGYTWPLIADASINQILKTDDVGNLSWTTLDIVNDTTPQLGGNLDVNSFSITSTNNGNISIVPNGTGNILLTPATGTITLGACNWPTGTGTANQVLTTDGTGNLTFQPPSATVLKDLVMNQTGVTIPKGSVVYITGANGDNPLISLAQASGESTSSKTLGFTMTELTQGASGYVITNGLLEGINTNIATIGDPVWLSPTTPGGMLFGLSNKPVAPNHMVYLGVVVRVNENNGAISVKVQNGYELNELHNVSNATPNNNDVLTYISSTGLWTPSASTGGGDVVSDLTPQLGGNLDVNGKSIISVSNGNIIIEPNGSGNILLTPATGHITLGMHNWPTTMGSNNQVLTNDGMGNLSWTTPSSGGGSSAGLETNFLLMGA